MTHQTIVVLDFGSQYTQLIARRLRELSVLTEILPFDITTKELRDREPAGIILSGGPRSMSHPEAPHCDAQIFTLKIPILGICYGMQEMTSALGGTVQAAPNREYGQATVTRSDDSALLSAVPKETTVWASHGDLIAAAPPGFTVTAVSANAPVAAMEHRERRLHARHMGGVDQVAGEEGLEGLQILADDL